MARKFVPNPFIDLGQGLTMGIEEVYNKISISNSEFVAHTQAAFDFLNTALNWAGIGVWLFYFVSGYIIFSAQDAFYKDNPVGFLKNRIVRIYPTMWLCLTISIIVIYFSGQNNLYNLYNNDASLFNYGIKEIIYSYSIVGGFLSSTSWSPLPQGFTTTVEVQFYLIAFSLFILAGRIPQKTQLIFFIAGLLCLISYLLIELTGTQYRFFGAFRFSPLFVLGASIFLENKNKNRGVWNKLILASALILSIHLILSTEGSSGYEGFSLVEDRTNSAISCMIFIGAFYWLTNISVQGKLKTADRILGELTYPMYLIQIPMLALALGHFEDDGLMGWVLLFLFCIALSAIINLGFERRFYSLRQHIRGKPL